MSQPKETTIKFRIPLDKKQALNAVAKKKDLDVSKLLMAEVDKLIEGTFLPKREGQSPRAGQGRDEAIDGHVEAEEAVNNKPDKQLYFYPFPGDQRKLTQYAEERDMKTTQLIRLIVRSWLTKEPLMPKQELAEIGLLSNQIGALGRNLNQLVKLAHAGTVPLPGELLALLERALHLTQQARKEVSDVVKINIASWENDYA